MLYDIERRLLALSLYFAGTVVFLAAVRYGLSRSWPLMVSGIALILLLRWLARTWWQQRTRGRLLANLADPDSLRSLTWREFEIACAGLFERRGWGVTVTPPSGDGGVDIVIRKSGAKGVVQCKHWRKRRVSVSEVRELLGAKQDFGADEAFMLTSGFATVDARKLARRNKGVHLWDRDSLIGYSTRALMQEVARDALKGESPSEREAPAVPAERICPDCGEKLVARDGRYGRFIGCTGFPNCRYTRDLNETEEDATN